MSKHISEQFEIPAAEMLGRHREDNHLEEPFTDADFAIGERLAEVVGDSFINCELVAPVTQWSCIVRALRHHGMLVVNDKAR